jgi:penicillin-binding protein 1B
VWGTARGLRRYLPDEFPVAVKTGTSDGQRDSWFAGYSGDLLGVAWLGKDDNSATPLTGSSGALSVWGEIFRHYSRKPLQRAAGEEIEYVWVDELSGLRSGATCAGAHRLPFVIDTAPTESTPCGRQAEKSGWLKSLFKRQQQR